jgi:hypothetical protein
MHKYKQNDAVMEDEIGRYFSMHWKKLHAFRTLVGESRKETARKTRRRLVDNIRMDLRPMRRDDSD